MNKRYTFPIVALFLLMACCPVGIAGEKAEYLVNEGIGTIDESRDSRYEHGCISVCYYNAQRCGWGKVQGDTDLNDLCDFAQERADYACYANFKYPVTKCQKYKTW